jgi:hypothetical protein
MNTFIGTSTNNDLAEALQGALAQLAPPFPGAGIEWTVETISGSFPPAEFRGPGGDLQKLYVTISSNAIPYVPPPPAPLPRQRGQRGARPADTSALADEKLTAFLDLERAIHEFAARFLADGLK